MARWESYFDKRNKRSARLWKLCYRGDGRKQYIFFGEMPAKRVRDQIVAIVSELEAFRAIGESVPRELLSRVQRFESVYYDKLAKHGFVPVRVSKALEDVFDDFLASKSRMATTTRSHWTNLRKRFVERFGEGHSISALTEIQLEDFFQWLTSSYATATVYKMVRRTKQLFRFALRTGRISSNPALEAKFICSQDELVAHKDALPDDWFAAALDAMPTLEWKAWLAYIRWMGARKMEPSHDRFEDIDYATVSINRWHNKRQRRQKAYIAHQLQPLLYSYIESVAESKRTGLLFPSVAQHPNTHTFLVRCLRKAGIQVWPKLFNTLRATRSTEIRGFCPKLESQMLGHSEAIAAKHYDVRTTAAVRQLVGEKPLSPPVVLKGPSAASG